MSIYRLTNIKIFIEKTVIHNTAICILLFGLIFIHPVEAQQKTDKPGNFYAITGNGLTDTSWLFGTYHLVKSSYLNEVPAVMNAFKKSNGVVVELVIDSAKLPAIYTMGILKDKMLTDLLDKPFSDSLESEVKNTLGVGLMQINNLKPINLALTLSMVYLVTDKNSPIQKYSGDAIDGFFAESGKSAGKKVTALETIEEQMYLLFNKLPDEEQVKQLKYFIRNKHEMIQQGNELINNWFSHDLNGMYKISEKGLQVFGNEDDLLKRRNEKWMKTIPALLKKESQFIAVGALHLASENGLIKLLEQSGYKVTAIKL